MRDLQQYTERFGLSNCICQSYIWQYETSICLQYVKEVDTTEFSFWLDEKWCINRLEIFTEQFTKGYQRLILPLSCFYNYKYPSIDDIDLTGLELDITIWLDSEKRMSAFIT